MLLQQLCSILLRHELHANLVLYQPLLGLTAGLQPLPSDHCWCASMFRHWRHLTACHSAFPSARVSSTRPPGTLWGWPYWPSCLETFSIAGSCDLSPCFGAVFLQRSPCSTSLRSWSCLLDACRRPHRFCDSLLLHVRCESVLSLPVEIMSGHCPSSSEPDSYHLRLYAEGSGMVTPAFPTPWPEQLCSSFSWSHLHCMASAYGNGPRGWDISSLIRMEAFCLQNHAGKYIPVSVYNDVVWIACRSLFSDIWKRLRPLLRYVVMELSLWWSFVFKPVSLEFFVCCHATFVLIKDVPCYIWRCQATCRNAGNLPFILGRNGSSSYRLEAWQWTEHRLHS